MENQGFEGEQQQQSRHDSRALSFDPSRIEFFPDGSVSNADGHVYEDILPGVDAGILFGRDNRESETNGPVDYASRDAKRAWDHEEICGGFRRNLTLPFRRGTGLEPSTATSSVRCTTNRSRDNGEYQEIARTAAWNVGLVVDDAFSREIAARAQSTPLQAEGRPNRRRRKKDCKHCRSKVASSAPNARECENDDKEIETVSRKNMENEYKQRTILVDPCSFSGLSERSSIRNADDGAVTRSNSSSVFTISEKIGRSTMNSPLTIESERNNGSTNLVSATETNVDNALTASEEKGRAGMRVNSIYSQDRWYAKEAAIFFTDVKEHSTFQRAYSLPVRTQTPSSQNRINLRRSVRGEPPPHPARLRKHRHGWTLHLAHPLEASGCTRSLVVLLVALLVLLGIGALALYIALEPEKLQIIQQYLRSPTNESSSQQHTLAAGTLLYPSNDEQRNESSSTEWTTATTLPENGTLVVSGDDRVSQDIGSSATTEIEIEAEISGPSSLNSSRHCDDCLTEEVCVALVDEGVPTCRIPLDPEDPTGCAGFCLINKQKCHRLDVDAFRCVEVEHYCLDDEWTCLNTLCIPLEKHCDGHMNCYDHSDEYSCACDLETHFHCGNETSCLPLEKRCDGKIDCWDAADEINCTLACPSENEFTCSNGQCILKARFCDGLPDCLDGSDEPHGCQGRCNKHEFTCQNSRCITKGMKCNGVDDCGDGTDERHCKNRSS